MVPTPDRVTPTPHPTLHPPELKHTHEAVERICEVEQDENGANRTSVFWFHPALTCRGDAVKSDKGVETGSSSRQDACETERHEAAHSETLFGWQDVRQTGQEK